MIVLGLDPGTERSTFVVLVDGQPFQSDSILPNIYNPLLATELEGDSWSRWHGRTDPVVLVIEQVESFGMAVGKEVFETVFWTGRFAQAWSPRRFERVPRRVVKQHLCHTARATDANIRQALIDRFGGPEKAIGKKKEPGPLHGIKSHAWAALAVGLTWYDLHGTEDVLRPGIVSEF